MKNFKAELWRKRDWVRWGVLYLGWQRKPLGGGDQRLHDVVKSLVDI